MTMRRIQLPKLPVYSLILLTACSGILAGCSKNGPVHAEPQKPRAVTVRPVIEQQLQASLQLPAELAPFEVVAIYPKETGFLEWIGVDRGTRVRKGQVLARLTAPEVDARRAQSEAQVQNAQSQLDAAQAKLASDEATSNHLRDAAKTPGVVAGNDLIVAEKTVEADRANVKAGEENVNAARHALGAYSAFQQYLQVTAPFDGIITERNVHPGALVGPSTDSPTSVPMLRLEMDDHLRLVVPVPQAYLSSISKGQKVEFTVPAYPNRKFTGTIARLSDSVDQRTRTMPVELDVSNRDGLLTPGTYSQVQWPIHRTGMSLVVPRTAITSDLEHSFVIRVRNNKTEWVNVQSGLTKDDLAEVFGDLKPGDLVVARATDELRPDTSVVVEQDSGKK
ncbi:MAG TPA: efflux RND transporter periplasmic adaptor subunit [Acidobacteriaceae bacterium]|nr:efflux RND transporter periplasmic adaptor subunit [Acidobacteriaceae bacterium]